MNRKDLLSAPVPLSDYGVNQAYYVQDDGSFKYQTTEKGVKLFVEISEYPGRRINFWMPKSVLLFRDGVYSEIVYACLPMLKANITKAVAQAKERFRREENDNRYNN